MDISKLCQRGTFAFQPVFCNAIVWLTIEGITFYKQLSKSGFGFVLRWKLSEIQDTWKKSLKRAELCMKVFKKSLKQIIHFIIVFISWCDWFWTEIDQGFCFLIQSWSTQCFNFKSVRKNFFIKQKIQEFVGFDQFLSDGTWFFPYQTLYIC